MFIIYSAASNPFDIPHRRINKLHDRRRVPARETLLLPGVSFSKAVILIIFPLRRATRGSIRCTILLPGRTRGPSSITHTHTHTYMLSFNRDFTKATLFRFHLALCIRLTYVYSSMSRRRPPLFSRLSPRVWRTDPRVFFFFFSSNSRDSIRYQSIAIHVDVYRTFLIALSLWEKSWPRRSFFLQNVPASC